MSIEPKKKNAAHDAWQRKNTTRVVMQLNNRTDADILEALDQQESKQGFIKSCIREHLQRKL